MARTTVTTKTFSSGIRARKIGMARSAVGRSIKLLRARNRRLRRRNIRTGGFLGIERKYVDQLKSASALTAPTDATGGEHDPATNNCLNAVAQGDTESARDGKNYIIKSLFIRGTVKWGPVSDGTVGQLNYPIFLAVVWDKQTNGAQLNSEDVFKNIVGTAPGAPLCMRNLQYSKRFKILWSKVMLKTPGTMMHDGTNFEWDGSRPNFFKVNLPFLNIRVECKGTGATVSDIVDNSLHFIAFAGTTNGAPTLDYASRIRFVG